MKRSIQKHKGNNYQAAKLILLIYIIALFVSYLFVILTGKYNGDFTNYNVALNVRVLTFNLLLDLFPFIILWSLYKKYKKKDTAVLIDGNENLFFAIAIFLLFIHILMSGVFGVGVLASDTYQAGSFIKPLIQVFYRFRPEIWAYLFILSSRNWRKILILLLLLILLSILRHSMGGIWSLGLVLLIRYHFFIVKYKVFILIFLFVFPFIIRNLYVFRTELRGSDATEVTEFSTTDLIADRFAGRLSCFSNTAYIMQEATYFYATAQLIQYDYFPRQAIKVLFGLGEINTTPEKVLIESTGYKGDSVSFMTGVYGNLLFSLMKSPVLLLINMLVMLFMIWAVFALLRMTHLKIAPEIALLLSINPILSGVASEFASALFAAMVVYLFYRFFSKYKIVL